MELVVRTRGIGGKENEKNGVEIYTTPAAVDIAPYGLTQAFSIKTPDGAILEFFELAH